MSQNMSIVLTPEEGIEQAVSIFADYRWSSPEGGWLTGQGKAAQVPEGVLLRDEAGRKRLWLLDLGFSAQPSASGRFREDSESPFSGALLGKWRLKDVS